MINMIIETFDIKEEKLLERMNAGILGNKIYITEFETVYTETIEGKKEELFDKFIKETEKKVLKKESSIKYDEEANQFYLIEDEPAKYPAKVAVYPIDIKKEYMEDYVFGKYNKITSAMHDLYLKSMTNEERQKMQINHKNQTSEIIAKMNTGHELPTPAEARIYLDYLEEITEENNKEIKDNAKEIGKVIAIPAGVGVLFAGASSFIAGAGSFIAVEGTLWGLVALEAGAAAYAALTFMTVVLPCEAYDKGTFTYIKNRINKIKSKHYDNQIIKTKAEKLYEIENVDKMIMAKSYSIEEFDNTVEDMEKRQLLNLKDNILSSIDEIVNRLEYINSEDRAILLEEAKQILEEYSTRYKNIVEQNNDTIDLEADNFVNLKIDMFSKITELENKLYEVRNKDVKIKNITDEEKLLTDKIDGFSTIDEEVEMIHANSEKKVKVKRLR